MLPDGTGHYTQAAGISHSHPLEDGIDLWTARHLLRRASATAGGAADSPEASGFISENESYGRFTFTRVLRKNRRSARTQSIIRHAEEGHGPRVQT